MANSCCLCALPLSACGCVKHPQVLPKLNNSENAFLFLNIMILFIKSEHYDSSLFLCFLFLNLLRIYFLHALILI